MIVFKYPIYLTNNIQTLQLPESAKVLAFQIQDGDMCIWVLMNPERTRITRLFRVISTGNALHDEPMEYIGTVQQPPYVWHLFEIGVR